MTDVGANTESVPMGESGIEKPHELRIFKTRKPIKECKDDRSLTSKKSGKSSSPTKQGFLQKIGFGSKSASVSPTKSVLAKTAALRRSSENCAGELRSPLQPKIVEATPEASLKSPPSEQADEHNGNNDKNATEEKAKSPSPCPLSSYEDPPGATTPNVSNIEATGTESDARVSQTIIMKKKTLHESQVEAVIVPLSTPAAVSTVASVTDQQPEVSMRNFDIVQPQMASVSATVSVSSGKPVHKSDKSASKASLATAAPTSARSVRGSEIDLSAPLSRLGMTAAAENKAPSDGSLAEKLSRSFFDLTQGSQDRLQRWKNKLQSGRQRRGKDSSEPPEGARKLIGLSDMDSLLEWTTTDKPKFVANGRDGGANGHGTRRMASAGPRPLHSSRSATNALEPEVTATNGANGIVKRASLREPGSSGTAAISPASNASEMEHRTLKARENLPAKGALHYQNMKNLQQLVQTIEGYSTRDLDLPPPARILPYSGIKPQDNGIIRPIAFRPLNQQNGPADLDVAVRNRENSRSIGNLAAASARQRVSGVPCTSSASSSTLFPLTTSNSASKIPPPPSNVLDENDYDTVPEFIERKPDGEAACSNDNYSLIYNFQPPVSSAPQHRRAQSGASSTGSGVLHYHVSGGQASSNASSTTSGIPNSSPHSSGSNGSVKKSASRHSGLHITPSPSDSGIVDFESLIRDKESELISVRNTMEQNEEVLVRVYQEKERQYREQLADLRQKLQASQQGEATLRQQLRLADERREELQRSHDGLQEEKNGLARKCQQIERELYAIRNRFDDFVRDTKATQARNVCEHCRRPQGSAGPSGKAPVPAPRLGKEERALRTEVDDLRGEVSSLRDQLNNQMQLFTEERRRWQNESKERSPSPKLAPFPVDKRPAVLLSHDRLI